MALDTISVSRAFEHDEDELRRARRIGTAVERALAGEIEFRRISWRPASRRNFGGRQKTSDDTRGHDRQFAVQPPDGHRGGRPRPAGLLYDLTLDLPQLELNIGSAHIATFGEKAADVFYVTDLAGKKITDAAQRDHIREALLPAFTAERTQIELSKL